MVGVSADGLFHQYKDLIGYAAAAYVKHVPIIDLEDLFQDGCLLMMEFFDGRIGTKDKRIHNTFKKSLFLWMRRTVFRRIRQSRPTGKPLLRLDSSGTIDLDSILAQADTCVLTKMYAQEFVAELRRVLAGQDLTIFDLIVRSTGTSDSVGDLAREASDATGIALSTVYDRITRIRNTAERILLRSA